MLQLETKHASIVTAISFLNSATTTTAVVLVVTKPRSARL